MSSMYHPTYPCMLPRWHGSETKPWWTTEKMSWLGGGSIATVLTFARFHRARFPIPPSEALFMLNPRAAGSPPPHTCWATSPTRPSSGTATPLELSAMGAPHRHHKWNRRRVWNLGQASHPTPMVHCDTVNLEFHRNLGLGYAPTK